jgi:hypothetical protein
MDALIYGQVKLPLITHNVIAAIDTGTALIYVHETFAKAFYKLVSLMAIAIRRLTFSVRFLEAKNWPLVG